MPTEEDTSANNAEDTESDTDDETNDGSIPRIIYDNSESEQGLYSWKNHHFLFVLPDVSDDESIYEPEEVKRAWEELMIIQREQQR